MTVQQAQAEPVRSCESRNWVSEERREIVEDSLVALKVAIEDHPHDIVIPNDLVFPVIVALADERTRELLSPAVLELVRSWVESFSDLDEVERDRIDRLIMHGERGFVA